VFMGRFYGMMLLSSCLTWYKTKNSLDATVPLTVMLSRLFVRICCCYSCNALFPRLGSVCVCVCVHKSTKIFFNMQ